MKIPKSRSDQHVVLEALQRAQRGDMPFDRMFGYVYDPGPEATEIANRAAAIFQWKNALDPTVYPSLLRFENEVVSMMASHLGGDDAVTGNFTSGGTESILLAVKVARDRARALLPHIARPAIVVPSTAHAAFHKAAHYLDLDVVSVPVSARTHRADPASMERAVTDATILLVGSAPSYAHGVVDPIEELAAVAQRRDLLLHVDGCIGGFLLPYFERLGAAIPPFDFRVKGVTSVSVDLHKYAYAPKGASVLLHRSKDLRRYQLYTCSRWPGYTLVNPTLQSSKSGAPLAAAWALLHYFGDEGYLQLARELRDATTRIARAVEGMPDLRLLAEPEMTLMAIASDSVNVFVVADVMKAKGWYVQPQLGFDGGPPNLHLAINPSNLERIDAFLEALAASVQEAKGVGPGELAAQVSGALAGLDPSAIDASVLRQMLAMGGIAGVDLPERMADINDVLDALPHAFKEKLLAEFANEIFRTPEGA